MEQRSARADQRQLTVVMPVYNEEASLNGAATSWISTLDALGIDYEMRIFDDGSRDSTADVLAALSEHPRVNGSSKPNEGHGPTILRGYREAVQTSEWVFQVDSDDEIPASAFPRLWNARHGHDAVLGRRTGRQQSVGRRAISAMASTTARVFYGSRLRDVNVPYRLMRSDVLAPIIAEIPDTTFAPNVVISGALSRADASVHEVSVPFTERQTGEVSIIGLGALKAAVRSFGQSVRLAKRFR